MDLAPRRPSSGRSWTNSNVIANAAGVVADRPLASLLIYALDARLTGSIVWGRPSGPRQVVFFENGRPSQAHTTYRGATLARVLRDLDLVGQDALAEGLALSSREGVVLARTLVKLGHITVGTLAQARGEQLRQHLLWIAALPRDLGFALYFDHNLVPRCHERPFSPIDPLPIVVEAIRRCPSAYPIDETIAALSRSVLSLHPEAPLASLELRLESRVVDALWRRPHTVRSLLAARVASEQVTKLALYALAVTRCLRRGREENTPLSRRARSVSSYPPPRHSGFFVRS
jgi:hypothetical protein